MIEMSLDDRRHLDAAIGWAVLGNLAESELELAALSASAKDRPETFRVMVEVYAAKKDWQASLAAAEKLVEILPDDSLGWIRRSFALHELKRTSEAYELLRGAVTLFPKEWTIPYNLSCYLCQMGRSEEAWKMFTLAVTVGDPALIKQAALEDVDLIPLRPRIEAQV